MQRMMADDAEASSRAITENVTHPDEINQAFSGPVYSKVSKRQARLYVLCYQIHAKMNSRTYEAEILQFRS